MENNSLKNLLKSLKIRIFEMRRSAFSVQRSAFSVQRKFRLKQRKNILLKSTLEKFFFDVDFLCLNNKYLSN